MSLALLRRRLALKRVTLLSMLLLPPASHAQGSSPAAATATPTTGLVVWDFDDQTPPGASFLAPLDRAWLKRALGEQLSQQLHRLPGVALVDRLRISDLLAEQRLGASELADDHTRLRLGRLMGATRMVFGSFFALGDQVQINLRLVEVGSGRVLHADELTTPVDNTMDAAQALAPRLVLVLGGGSTTLRGYPAAAWRALDAALAQLDQGRHDQALASLQALLAQHPDFAPAERQVPLLLERMRRR